VTVSSPTLEASATGASNGQRTTGELGVILFLASDIMLFAPFFAAYFLLRSTTDGWPPESVDLDALRALVATLVLVTSSFTLIVADRALEHGNRTKTLRWILATVVLGTIFLGNQVAEYVTLDFRPTDHTYGSIYWAITMLHAAHVTAGLIALSALYVRVARADPLSRIATWAKGVSLFWHLVDIVWVAVFLTIWVIR
jgi:cytochrome c oxidase subunit 3